MDLKRESYLNKTGLKPVSRIARGGRERKKEKIRRSFQKLKCRFGRGYKAILRDIHEGRHSAA